MNSASIFYADKVADSDSGSASLHNIRFFFRVVGVLADFTSHAAKCMDNLVLPHPSDGIFEESMIQRHFVPEVLYDICSGEEFWREMPLYNWSFMLFQRAYMLSKGNVYFLGQANIIDSGSWSGKFNWCFKNFGKYGVDRLVLSIDAKNLSLVCSGKNDVLVTAIKSEAMLWNECGGTALHFPEIDPYYVGAADFVGARLNMMDDVAKYIKTL
jgi:hypothetical protein